MLGYEHLRSNFDTAYHHNPRAEGESLHHLFMMVVLSVVILFSDLRLLELSRVLSIVFLLTSASIAGTVTLAWDPNPEPDIVGYDVWYGTASGRYDQSVDVGNSTTATISNLTTQGFWLALFKPLMLYDLNRFDRISSHGFDGLGEVAVAGTA